ncbi:CDP-alcohol phosphatidyltransferase family protein [Roseibium aestuarii]|uniref:CDP-alcohol phosphatidyltransferase family protein n=1 Tax=Roseibium aestuarii TaxID=2600299 RepID=A0ABW4JPA7_9HYPH|nr:CDP-alcohol phosphatidyltransferase family protein [Roseibium aestuarii]
MPPKDSPSPEGSAGHPSPAGGVAIAPAPAGTSPGLKRSALLALALIFPACAVTYWIAARALNLGPGAGSVALVLLALIFALVLRGLRHHPFPRFGPANVTTSLRAGLGVFAAAALVLGNDLSAADPRLWPLLALALLALVLDGLDGFLARRSHLSSRFGARYDMELDAFLILGLSLAVVALDKAGPWALLIGAMRYLFVAGSYVWPWLDGPLPPSWRRKAVCVWQIAALCLALVPSLPVASATMIAGSALLLLAWSFAVDIATLWRLGRQAS